MIKRRPGNDKRSVPNRRTCHGDSSDVAEILNGSINRETRHQKEFFFLFQMGIYE